ncbi:MAG: hypothetical protein CMC51_00765 [Flavobacteriaceae bacterium]|nr:hypothetical protein [Flavobacteriaceae bacterium]
MKKIKKEFLLKKNNFRLIILGLLFIIIGFILMSGGGSEDPNFFDNNIYDFQKIRLAPTLILIGFVIQIYSILKSSKK